jgi:hypothetical protein
MKSLKRFFPHGLAGVAVVLVAVSLGANGACAAQAKQVSEKTFDFAAGGEVAIESSNGRIVVEAWDRPKARIQVTRSVRAPDEKQAQELMKALRADVEIQSHRIEIVSRYPKRREGSGFWDFLGRKVASMDIHYYLQVPRATALVLETSNGEIRVLGVSKRVEASTTNGDVRVSGAGGSVSAETTNGEIELLGISGSVEASTTNGSVRAEVRSLSTGDHVDLTTTNGNVSVRLPASTKATLEAGTTNGRVSTSFPITVNDIRSSKSIKGTIGGGGARVDLVTTNGNVQVLKSGER